MYSRLFLDHVLQPLYLDLVLHMQSRPLCSSLHVYHIVRLHLNDVLRLCLDHVRPSLLRPCSPPLSGPCMYCTSASSWTMFVRLYCARTMYSHLSLDHVLLPLPGSCAPASAYIMYPRLCLDHVLLPVCNSSGLSRLLATPSMRVLAATPPLAPGTSVCTGAMYSNLDQIHQCRLYRPRWSGLGRCLRW
jgi:hypothetical protein